MNSSSYFCLLWCMQIILESLPISSSGHIKIINMLIARVTKHTPLTISSGVDHIMHIPTIFISFLFLMKHGMLNVIFDTPTTVFQWIVAIIIANSITAFFYMLIKIKNIAPWHTHIGFILSACALLSLYLAPGGTKTVISYSDAIVIGIAQSFALLPGISRLGLTFSAGVWLGLLPTLSLMFSLMLELFLAVPAIALALYKNKFNLSPFYHLRLADYTAIGVSSLIAYAALELLYRAAEYGLMNMFGWYLLALGIFLKVLFLRINSYDREI